MTSDVRDISERQLRNCNEIKSAGTVLIDSFLWQKESIRTVPVDFVDALENNGVVKFLINAVEVALEKDDCLIAPAQKSGFVSQTEGDMTVVI